MALKVHIILSKNSSKPVPFTRGGARCVTNSFQINFSFAFNQPDHEAITVEGILETNSDFFSIDGDNSVRFISVEDGAKRDKSIVVSFPNLPDDDTRTEYTFMVTLRVTKLNGTAVVSSTSVDIKQKNPNA